jgi:hypothetical protein
MVEGTWPTEGKDIIITRKGKVSEVCTRMVRKVRNGMTPRALQGVDPNP